MSATNFENEAEPPEQRRRVHPKGLYCSNCGCGTLLALDTHKKCPGVITRYRECARCKKRFKTREIIITRDG